MQLPWPDKYRPASLDEFIFKNKEHADKFTDMIQNKNIPHLLLSGHSGSGKTSMAYILKDALGIPDADFRKIDASTENSVDDVRTKIAPFLKTCPTGDNDFKIVFLDEADRLSVAAQESLRSIMEDGVDNVRFIFTCNKPLKIIPPLHSRLQEFKFERMEFDTTCMRVISILKKEGIRDYDTEKLVQFIEMYYPDIRKILNQLESAVVGRSLNLDAVQKTSTVDTTEIVAELLSATFIDNSWSRGREILNSIDCVDNVEQIFSDMVELIEEMPDFECGSLKWRRAVIVICDHITKIPLVADQRLNILACVLRILEVRDE